MLPRGVVPVPPGPGQESVWDYPRPPRVEPVDAEIVAVLGGVEIVRTGRSYRVLETSHPPTYYLPRADFAAGALEPARGSSFCEWKGLASYLTLVGGIGAGGTGAGAVGAARIGGAVRAEAAAWFYPTPTAGFAMLADHVAFYAGQVDRVTVAGEQVRPQPGGFYAGWITSGVVGPFKGIPGSMGW